MPHQKTQRIILAGIGGLLVLTALVANGVHADMLASLGRAQLLFIMVGSGLLFGAVTWSRAAELYRGGAVMLVTAVLLFLMAELAAGPALSIVRRLRPPQVDSHGAAVRREDLSYVANTDWAADFWPEHREAEAALGYEPYVLWRTAPFAGALTNITRARFRLTPGSDCTDAYQVFVFGGSTVWGWGVPDWGTIPAYLQEHWDSEHTQICVVNMGQNGFVSTQEIIALVRELQQDRVPDLVVFYDGFNDVHAAFETGFPGVHYAPERIAEKLESTAPPPLLGQAMERSKLVGVWGELKGEPGGPTDTVTFTSDPPVDTLRASIVRTYRRNLEVVSLLGERFGFEYMFFWQPNIYSGAKQLNPEEQAMFDHGLTVGFVPLLEEVHRSVGELSDSWDRLDDLSATFDNVSFPVWQDFIHLTPEGNRLVAERIIAALIARDVPMDRGVAP